VLRSSPNQGDRGHNKLGWMASYTGWWWDEQRVAPGLLWWDGTWVWQVFWPNSGRDVKQRGM
jgi:hypothetical protein